MKLLVLLAGLVALCSSETIPTVPGDNSHYVKGQSRYIWMPDGEGTLHLVDLHKPVDEAVIRNNRYNNVYWLYSRENPASPQVIVQNDIDSIQNSNYLPSRPLVVLVHGWNSNGDSSMNPAFTSAFLSTQDVNVLVLDWGYLAGFDYNTAAAGAVGCGEELGSFLEWLISTAGGDWNYVHLIGFSMGSPIAASAARITGSRARRLTGLDPPGRLFEGTNMTMSSNDAQYVEAIHTDGNNIGIFHRSGHADFYPNGGVDPQPGCVPNSSCSHIIVLEYFESSVRTNHLVGRQCVDIDQAAAIQCEGAEFNMGNGLWDKRGSGIYGLRTRVLWPH